MEHEVPTDLFRSYYWPNANLPHPYPDPSNAHLPSFPWKGLDERTAVLWGFKWKLLSSFSHGAVYYAVQGCYKTGDKNVIISMLRGSPFTFFRIKR